VRTRAIDPAGVRDAGAFLARVERLDPTALVRLRPHRPGVIALWARLPLGVLVTRLVRSELDIDATVRAAELLAALERGDAALPPRCDIAWRSALPPAALGVGTLIDEVPAEEVRRVSAAAARTVQEAAMRGIGERALRDTLLDQIVMTVISEKDPTLVASVPLRMVQALVRMGFLGADPVRVRQAGPWLGMEATYGAVWYRPASPLTVR